MVRSVQAGLAAAPSVHKSTTVASVGEVEVGERAGGGHGEKPGEWGSAAWAGVDARGAEDGLGGAGVRIRHGHNGIQTSEAPGQAALDGVPQFRPAIVVIVVVTDRGSPACRLTRTHAAVTGSTARRAGRPARPGAR